MVIDETELEGLTEDQRDAYIALKEGRNVFLSGNAGTGKSYVLNRFIDDLRPVAFPTRRWRRRVSRRSTCTMARPSTVLRR